LETQNIESGVVPITQGAHELGGSGGHGALLELLVRKLVLLVLVLLLLLVVVGERGVLGKVGGIPVQGEQVLALAAAGGGGGGGRRGGGRRGGGGRRQGQREIGSEGEEEGLDIEQQPLLVFIEHQGRGGVLAHRHKQPLPHPTSLHQRLQVPPVL
jgi:hypothetical protein